MPTYAFECQVCRREFERWLTISERSSTQIHCDKPAKRIMNAPMIAPLFQEYRAIAGDRRYIRNRAEHLDFLKEFGYQEVGNDTSYAPPPDNPDEDARRARELKESMAELETVSKYAD